jgi:four helix bundle protein
LSNEQIRKGTDLKNFKELVVWQKSHRMTLDVYNATRGFPREELYGLTSQLRRSVASIGANIAEGSGRRSNNEICRFLQIARGSASEAEYHLLLSRDLRFLNEEDFRRLSRQADEVQRMLTALIQSFHATTKQPSEL